jgi:hypothetical protein
MDEAVARVRRVRHYLAEHDYLLRKTWNQCPRPGDAGGYAIVRADNDEVVAGLGFTLTVDDLEAFAAEVQRGHAA